MPSQTITGAVEGVLDEAVLQRLLSSVDCELDPVHGKRGKPWLRDRIEGFNMAAVHQPWLVLIDLDKDADCPSQLRDAWLANRARHMHLRVAVRSVEAWLLADRERIASFLSVAQSKVPARPEDLEHPKQALINLARNSRRRDIQQDLVPRTESGRTEGPAYTSRLVEFVLDSKAGWRPEAARANARSLERCLLALRRLARGRSL